ncbi:MAG: protein kinase family protein [Candidatus Melainabacteria bacterium]|nr:protein kinase family protein [Candidatus Melainabacteria bacterium]
MSTKITNHLSNMSHSARLENFELASTALSRMSDVEMQNLLDSASTAYSGIDGTAVSLEVNGIKVFAKRVSVTRLEMLAENLMSTRNIFNLPPSFHYGIVSLGFGAWRELASHTMTTNWVRAQKCESFPLLYHSRILENQAKREATVELKTELSNLLSYWNNLDSVSLRLNELENSTTQLILFLEHVPHNLFAWLNNYRESTEDEISAACTMIERNLRREVPFMSANGFLHLDAHSKNILTDGQRLFFTDFGLAMSTQFDLSADEIVFAADNILHDSSHTIAQLVNWLVTAIGGNGVHDIRSRNDLIVQCASGVKVEFSSETAAVIIYRYAAIAALFNDFYGKLFQGFTETPFPADQLSQAWTLCTA